MLLRLIYEYCSSGSGSGISEYWRRVFWFGLVFCKREMMLAFTDLIISLGSKTSYVWQLDKNICTQKLASSPWILLFISTEVLTQMLYPYYCSFSEHKTLQVSTGATTWFLLCMRSRAWSWRPGRRPEVYVHHVFLLCWRESVHSRKGSSDLAEQRLQDPTKCFVSSQR